MAALIASQAAAGAAILLAIAFGIAASYTDLKERRVPNKLTLVFAVAALGLALASGKLTPAFAACVAIAFAFAYLAYRAGAWAGGDAKFFTVTTAFYAIAAGPAPLAFANLFLSSVIAMVPVAAIAFGPKALEAKINWAATAVQALKAGAVGAVVAVVGALLLNASVSGALAATGFAAAFVLSFVFTAFPALAAAGLRRVKKVGELAEGDIPAATVLEVKGKAVVWKRPAVMQLLANALGGRMPNAKRPAGKVIADSSRAAGMTASEITKLKQLGVRELEVRLSVAFAPAVALGFALSLFVRWF